MKKVTKKKLQADHNKLLNQFADLVRDLKSSKVISEETCPTFYRRTTEIVDDTCEQAEPKLKKLDQSVFPLIERDIAKELLEVDLSSELTGSELCKAMLERGDNYIMCRVGLIKEVVIINKFEDGWFYSQGIRLADPTPINNQGEPLTQSDVGL